MKKIVWFRHAEKDREMISEEGLKKAKELGIAFRTYGDFRYTCAGPMARAQQTLAAFLLGVCVHGPCLPRFPLPSIPEIGNEEMFLGWKSRGFADAVKVEGSNLAAMKSIFGDEYQAEAKRALSVVESILPKMIGNSTTVVFGHDPIISAAAEAAGGKDIRSLKELEGYQFTQQEDGSISVELIPLS